MPFRLKILGSNSAAPAFNRNQTAQILLVNNTYFLIDCGEGTQVRIRKARVKINKIDHILISHLHGDHYFGLIGLISTMHLFGRTKDLNIYCPSPLKEIIDIQLKYSDTLLNYKINYLFTDKVKDRKIYENRDLTVEKFPLNHQIFCTGFLFKEKKKKYKIRKEKLPDNFSIANISKIKQGLDIVDEENNVIFNHKDITYPPKKSRSYAFCSDTKYDEDILKYIKGVDLLYHEATFAKDMEERAESTFHSTAEQAGKMALKADADKLIIGHYSVRYRDLDVLINEAKSIFPNSQLAIEGTSIDVED